MVGATSDGASVNTGCYNGLLTQFRRERSWLVTVHCVSHRVELALKDSILKSKEFDNIKDFMIGIYYSFRNSGELKRQFKELGEVLDCTVYTFPKVHGTRFVAHQRNGLHALLNNWIPLTQTLTNICARPNLKNAKLLGYLKKLKSYDFLSSVCLYKGLLDAITPMSLSFQKGDLFLFDIQHTVALTKCHVNDLLEDDFTVTNPVSCYASQYMLFDSTTNTLTSTIPKKGHMKRKKENREYTNLTLNLTNTGDVTLRHMKNLRDTSVPRVVEALDSRFDFSDGSTSSGAGILKHMMWIDPANWVDNVNEEVGSILELAKHFETPLKYLKFDFDEKNIKKEWRNLKLTVKNYYSKLKVKQIWQRILEYRKDQFQNITKLVQIIYALGPSNAFVESAFSVLNSMLNDKRLNLKHSTMENLFLIKANAPNLDKADIVEKALKKHMNKRRKVTMEGGTDTGVTCSEGTAESASEQHASQSESNDYQDVHEVGSDSADNDSDWDSDHEELFEKPENFFEYTDELEVLSEAEP